MLKKSLEEVVSFISGDKILIKEVLHPKNDSLDLPYSMAHGQIEVGKESVPHLLKGKEVYYFLQGEGEIYIDQDMQTIKSGDAVLVPSFAKQYVKNKGNVPLTFLCIVSPPWSEEEEAIL